jgi:GNAT superfamily N-acetyltransferase
MENISISTDRTQLDLNMIHEFLRQSYWAKDISRTRVQQSIAHSLCFGLYLDDRQIGFARVVTDYTAIAYLADVFVLEAYRRRGLGKQLVQFVLKYPELKTVRKWLLATADAHGLYQQLGFEPIAAPEMYLQRFVEAS